MVIQLADPSLVLLIGPSGSGKSTFARRHFRATEVLSSDFCRALVCDNESNQAATDDAFELLHLILAKRLQRFRTTVIDATNVDAASRGPLAEPARQRNIAVVAIVFALPGEVCQARNQQRAYRQVSRNVVDEQLTMLASSIVSLPSEGFDAVFVLRSELETETVTVVRRGPYS